MGNFYMESTQINYRRDEKTKTVDQKLQELSETSAIDTDIAPVFKSTNTYQPGDMVYYRNKLYVFNVEHTGAWAAGDVTATDVTTEISSLKSGLTNVESRIEAVEVSLVAQSGSTGTIAAKLNSMVSALNALSTDRKRNAVLLMGTTVFHIANTQSNQFTQASYSANTTTTTIRCIDMIANASIYNVTRLTTSGASMEDASSTENTTVFYLYA